MQACCELGSLISGMQSITVLKAEGDRANVQREGIAYTKTNNSEATPSGWKPGLIREPLAVGATDTHNERGLRCVGTRLGSDG